MAQSAPAFEFGPAGMVEPMLQAFSNNPFLTQSFGPQMFSPDAMPAFPGFGGETLSFDPMGWTDPGRGRAPETPFETWLSLFPSAPMFGVQWAFWPMIASFVPNPQGMFGMGEFGLGEPGDSAAGAGEMPKTTRQTTPEISRAEREREALAMPGGVRAPEPAPRTAPIAEQPTRDPSSVVVPLPKRNSDNGAATIPARTVSAETRKAPLKTPTAKTEAAKLSAPATKPATAKAPVAKAPAAKAPAAKAPAAKPAATKTAATKSVAAKAPKAKGTTAKTSTAKASTAKATTTKAPAQKAKPAKAAKPAATPAKKKRGADGRPGNLLSKAPAKVDDLKKIKGVGEKLEMVLNDLGIYQYKQIAAFDVEDYSWLDGRLGAFKGRGVRDDWSAQAKALLKK